MWTEGGLPRGLTVGPRTGFKGGFDSESVILISDGPSQRCACCRWQSEVIIEESADLGSPLPIPPTAVECSMSSPSPCPLLEWPWGEGSAQGEHGPGRGLSGQNLSLCLFLFHLCSQAGIRTVLSVRGTQSLGGGMQRPWVSNRAQA